MNIDPVVVLAEELRMAKARLAAASEANRHNLRGGYGDEINRLALKIKQVCSDILETPPTSVLGAGVLIRMAAERLPFTYCSYAVHFREIADRFDAGQRDLNDLIWLRAMSVALRGGLCGESGAKAARLLQLAMSGAGRPVVVFRSVTDQHVANRQSTVPPPAERFGPVP